MNQEMLNQIAKFATQLTQAITAVAPKAWAVYVQVTQATAIAYIASTTAALLIACILGTVLLVVGRKCYDSDNQSGFYIFSGVCYAAGLAALLVLVFNPWWFISAFLPQLGAAHQVLSQFTNI